MKTQKLIPLLDYVLEKHEKWMQSSVEVSDDMEYINDTSNYAKFLSQPLKISMFVVCDENGNILEEPNNLTEENFNEVNPKIQEYYKAKSNVLFEGFFDNGTGCAIFQQNPNAMVIDNSIEGKRLEILLDSKCILTLTENAVKTING